MSVPQLHDSVEVKVFRKSAISYIVKLCNNYDLLSVLTVYFCKVMLT